MLTIKTPYHSVVVKGEEDKEEEEVSIGALTR